MAIQLLQLRSMDEPDGMLAEWLKKKSSKYIPVMTYKMNFCILWPCVS